MKTTKESTGERGGEKDGEIDGACAGRRALIVSGGEVDLAQLRQEIVRLRQEKGILIAADSGLEPLRRLEEAVAVPDVAVGDFDSVSSETLALFQRQKEIRFERHRPEKNESDTELAFTIAEEAGASEVLLMGATGTRLDHVLSNIHLLKAAMNRGLSCRLLDAHNRVRLVSGPTVFRREECPWPYISFIPLTAEVTHVRLTGFKYPLEDYHMILGEECGHCVSNEIAAEEAVLEFADGLVLAVESRDQA